MKNCPQKFPKVQGDFCKLLVLSDNSPKLKDIQFTIIQNKKQQILTLEKLEPVNVSVN